MPADLSLADVGDPLQPAYMAYVQQGGKLPFQAWLKQLSHSDLLGARNKMGAVGQEQLGPLEHAAFAKEWTKENPYLAVPSLTAAIPLYTLAKLAGLKSRSGPSLEEMTKAYKGMWEGLTE